MSASWIEEIGRLTVQWRVFLSHNDALRLYEAVREREGRNFLRRLSALSRGTKGSSCLPENCVRRRVRLDPSRTWQPARHSSCSPAQLDPLRSSQRTRPRRLTSDFAPPERRTLFSRSRCSSLPIRRRFSIHLRRCQPVLRPRVRPRASPSDSAPLVISLAEPSSPSPTPHPSAFEAPTPTFAPQTGGAPSPREHSLSQRLPHHRQSLIKSDPTFAHLLVVEPRGTDGRTTMPLLRRRPVPLLPVPEFDEQAEGKDPQVYYLKATGEIFKDYELRASPCCSPQGVSAC
jgi:hypothetical protein